MTHTGSSFFVGQVCGLPYLFAMLLHIVQQVKYRNQPTRDDTLMESLM